MDEKLQQEIAKHFEERGVRGQTILLPILDRLVMAVPLVATERAAEYRDLLRKHKVTIVLDHNTHARFSALPPAGKIFLGVDGLERSWAYCHLFVGAFALYLSDKPQKLDAPPADELLQTMVQSLDWAVENDLEQRGAVYPAELPQPRANPYDGSYFEQLHFNSYVTAVAWIILHEIAHLVLGHSTEHTKDVVRLRQDELDADAWAADWMLSKAESQDIVLQRLRAICIGVALAAYLEMWVTFEGEPDHPRYPQRLVAMLDRFGPLVSDDRLRKGLWMTGAMLVFQRAALADKQHLFEDYNFYRRPRLYIRRAMAVYPNG